MKSLSRHLLDSAILTALSLSQVALADTPQDQVAAKLAIQAQNSTLGHDLVESLTVEVGPRLASSEADSRAVAWAEAKLTQLGFDRVYKEPVTVPVWKRGDAKAEIISPFPHKLVVTALGGSVATPEDGIKAEIIRFASLAKLEAADPALVNGKIVFIDQKTDKTKTGAGYGKSVPGRSKGAVAAAEKGALALIIRSIGTDSDRMAHTGVMHYRDGVAKIPAAAVSNPDADLIEAMIKRDPKVVLSLKLSTQSLGETTSYNVIAEVTGSSKADEIVLIGAHLDSWDEGTGAIDDGAGVAIVTAAAKLIQDLPHKPARTVRVVLYAAEELGLLGGKAYAKAHAAEMDKHYIAAESDFGAGQIYRLDWKVNDQALTQVLELTNPMAKIGVEAGDNLASGGPDVSVLPELGVPVASLRQNGIDYFDFHHTPNDTLDKIDPKALAQNVAAYALFAYQMANANLELRPVVATKE